MDPANERDKMMMPIEQEQHIATLQALGVMDEENTELRAELDRMTAAVIDTPYFKWSNNRQEFVCRHCVKGWLGTNEEHDEKCRITEARAIRVKYGFDK